MNHSFQPSGDTGVLAIRGDLTIEDAAELKSALAGGLAAATHLVLDLSEAASADLCCLQLLCAAHRAAAQSGKSLELGNTGEVFVGSAEDAGFLRHAGCLDEAGARCLWCE